MILVICYNKKFKLKGDKKWQIIIANTVGKNILMLGI